MRKNSIRMIISILICLLMITACYQQMIPIPIPGTGDEIIEKIYSEDELVRELNFQKIIKDVTAEKHPSSLNVDIQSSSEQVTMSAKTRNTTNTIITATVGFTDYSTGSVLIKTGEMKIEFKGNSAENDISISNFSVMITKALKVDDLISDELYTVETKSPVEGSITATATISSNNVTFANVSNISLNFASKISVDNTEVSASGISGDGKSESSAYTISTADELIAFQKGVNDGSITTNGKYFQLGASIDLEGMEWTPIGIFDGVPYQPDENNPYVFSGNFNGNNYTISNFIVNATEDNSGFFGVISKAEVKNLKFSNAEITSTGNRTAVFAGAVNFSDISNITIEDNCSVDGKLYAAGVIGASWDNTVTGCVNNGSVVCTSFSGGVIGFVQSNKKIDSCVNTGSVKSTDADYYGIGGVIGFIVDQANTAEDVDPTYVSNCKNTGAVTVSSNKTEYCVGGIVGQVGAEGGALYDAHIEVVISGCSNSGKIMAGEKDVSDSQKFVGRLRHMYSGSADNITVTIDGEVFNNPS